MRKTPIVLFFIIVWIAVTSLALLFGFTYNWPDYVHVDYGIPLTWATNTLNTFTGPVDQWTVNTLNLLADLVFWLSIMAAVTAVLLYKLKA